MPAAGFAGTGGGYQAPTNYPSSGYQPPYSGYPQTSAYPPTSSYSSYTPYPSQAASTQQTTGLSFIPVVKLTSSVCKSAIEKKKLWLI